MVYPWGSPPEGAGEGAASEDFADGSFLFAPSAHSRFGYTIQVVGRR